MARRLTRPDAAEAVIARARAALDELDTIEAAQRVQAQRLARLREILRAELARLLAD